MDWADADFRSFVLQVALLFWAPAVLLVSIRIMSQYLLESRRLREESYARSLSNREIERFEYSLMRQMKEIQVELDRNYHLMPMSLERSIESLGTRILSMIRTELSDEIRRNMREATVNISYGDSIISDLGPRRQIGSPASGEVEVKDDQRDPVPELMREISHALNTPLAQIEASLLNLMSNETIRSGQDQETFLALKSMEASLDACKAIIAAYRELTLVSQNSSGWCVDQLDHSITVLTKNMLNRIGKKLIMSVDLPEAIQGYSNNFVLAMLLPLVENAVDSAPDGSELSIRSRKDGDTEKLTVSNTLDGDPPTAAIYESGFSTKPGHDGMGLSIVHHLISSFRGASLSHEVDTDRITFQVSLPARMRDGN